LAVLAALLTPAAIDGLVALAQAVLTDERLNRCAAVPVWLLARCCRHTWAAWRAQQLLVLPHPCSGAAPAATPDSARSSTPPLPATSPRPPPHTRAHTQAPGCCRAGAVGRAAHVAGCARPRRALGRRARRRHPAAARQPGRGG
jgi:hypothetical protein